MDDVLTRGAVPDMRINILQRVQEIVVNDVYSCSCKGGAVTGKSCETCCDRMELLQIFKEMRHHEFSRGYIPRHVRP